jgi:hypothetical protein
VSKSRVVYRLSTQARLGNIDGTDYNVVSLVISKLRHPLMQVV